MDSDAKVLIALFVLAAILVIALFGAIAYTSTPRQYGDKVCINVGKELTCESIAE